jgi:hypothetical protein
MDIFSGDLQDHFPIFDHTQPILILPPDLQKSQNGKLEFNDRLKVFH